MILPFVVFLFHFLFSVSGIRDAVKPNGPYLQSKKQKSCPDICRDRNKYIILRYHPAWRDLLRTHSTHTHDMLLFVYGEAHSVSHTLINHFCLPSEAHSELFFMPRSQPPRLSEIKGIKPTHSSSSVYFSTLYHRKNRLSSVF